jgi:hypothetical protein
VAFDVSEPGTVRLPIFAVIIFASVTLSVDIFEVVMLADTRLARVRTVRFVTFAAVETFRVVTLPVTMLPEAIFAVMTFADAILASVRTVRFVMFAVVVLLAKMLAFVLIVRLVTVAEKAIFNVPMFDIQLLLLYTLIVTTFALTILARFRTDKSTMLEVKRFADTTLNWVGTTRVPMLAERVLMVPILALPSTYRLDPTGGFERVPILTPF